MHRLLLELEHLGVKLSSKGERLLFEAPADVMSDELRRRIGARKTELLELLAPAMRLASDSAAGEIDTDILPLTPNHAWYLSTFEPETHGWAITLVVDVSARISAERLRAALAAILRRHDVFRLRMSKTPAGRWSLRMLPNADETQPTLHDMSGLSADARATALHAAGLRQQSSLSIVSGPVVAMSLCRHGHDDGDTLIISMHHHIVDGYSVNLFLEELLRTYQETETQTPPGKSTAPATYRDFLLRLHTYTHTPMFIARALSFWRDSSHVRRVPPIPVDIHDGRHTDLNSRVVSTSLDKELLRTLTRIGAPRKLQLNDLLLIALAHAYDRWSDGRPLKLDVEHNGRSEVIPGLSLSRTIGPTTMKFPLLLEVDSGHSLQKSLESLGNRIHETTDNLLGHGMLRYTCPDASLRDELASCAPAQVFFNNRAALAGPRANTSGALALARQMALPQPGLHENPVSHDLIIECERREESLLFRWLYSSTIHQETTIRSLAENFTAWLRALARDGGA